MKTRQEVEKFLEEIKVKVSTRVLRLLYLNSREKNARTLLDLEIPPNERTDIIMKLKAEDFYRVEVGKYLDQFQMLSFGKTVKGTEVYIKISITEQNVVCISFQEAEYPINYPFK